MRIVHVAPSFCRRDGGPSEVLRGLLPALTRAGVEVTLVSTDKGLTQDDWATAPADDIRVVRHVGPYSLSFAPKLRAELRHAIADADLVHVHAVDNYVSLEAMRLARASRVPYVVEPHGALDRYHRRQGWLKKRAWGLIFQDRLVRRAAEVIVSSSFEASEASSVLGRQSFGLMPLGVDIALHSVRRASSDEDTVLFLGRVARKKRLDLVLEAVAALHARGESVRLVVAGPLDSDLSFDPHLRAAELGISHAVSFVGTVGPVRRRELLAESACFVAPSDDESFGVAVAEAFVAGTPVVATATVGVVSDLAAGGLVRPVEPEPVAIADAISAAFEAPVDDALTAAARERWTWDASARAALAIYESCR